MVKAFVVIQEVNKNPRITKTELLMYRIHGVPRLEPQQDLVLEVEGGLVLGARLTISESALAVQLAEEERQKHLEDAHQRAAVEHAEQQAQMDFALRQNMSAHEHSHANAEERMNKLKRPWERVSNDQKEEDFDPNAQQFSNKDLYHKFKPRPPRERPSSLQLQKFIYTDSEFIACAGNEELVLGLQQVEGRVMNVVLVKRIPEDVSQHWILQDNGLIQSKLHPSMVLTASMPSSSSPEEDRSYIGCPVTLQKQRTSQFGRANQRWHFNHETGLIQAFYTDLMDKELTAANWANVCTYAVMGAVELDQPGFTTDIQTNKGSKPRRITLCLSCARAMRGRHKLDKIEGNVDFACAMGSAKQLGVRQDGSFQCLNGKVDLSTYEVDHTLAEWEKQLVKLREKLSVKAVAKEITAARSPYTVKVLVYRNGEGRLKPGQLIVGSSIAGILEAGTLRLRLNTAGRKLFTVDGTQVLDVDDLVQWAQVHYVKDAKRALRQQAQKKKQAAAQSTANGESQDLMSKVQFDSEEDEEEGAKEEDEKKEEQEEAHQEEEDESEDFALGYEVLGSRQHLDSWVGTVVIPNPAEEVEQNGFIYTWNFYASRPGNVALQVFRPSLDDLTAFTLISQLEVSINQPDDYSIDVAMAMKNGAGMEVKGGDLIGFYCAGASIVPYDNGDEVNQSPFWLMVNEKPSIGDELKMDTWMQQGYRQYSFNVFVRPTHKAKVKTAQEEPEKPEVGIEDSEEVQEVQEEAKKEQNSKSKKERGPHVEPPPVELVLAYPIEVWVSKGEAFVHPDKVEVAQKQSIVMHENMAAVSQELDREKHVLRHLQGRRYDELNPGYYKGTANPVRPVLIEGHWQEPSFEEIQKHDTVHRLQTHLSEVKASQKSAQTKSKTKHCNTSLTKRLYTQPPMMRVLVFPNGEDITRAVNVWGDSLSQLLDNATTRLNMHKPGKFLFTVEGEEVKHIDDIERDQLLCVSPTRQFIGPKQNKQKIEIKANWGRARKQYGPNATDIIVTGHQNPGLDVDAFAPSSLNGGSTQKKTTLSPGTLPYKTYNQDVLAEG